MVTKCVLSFLFFLTPTLWCGPLSWRYGLRDFALSQQFRINEFCRPIFVQGQFVDTPGLGDCALYGLLAMADPILRPPPIEPTAAQAVHVWVVHRTLASIPGPWETTRELLHLAWMFPKTVVTLGLHLGTYEMVVQVIDSNEYVIAEPDHPWEGGPHAVTLQTSNHFAVYMPVEKKAFSRAYPPREPFTGARKKMLLPL